MESKPHRGNAMPMRDDGAAVPAPGTLRRVFDDTPEDSCWLIVAAPRAA
jgi:hypothetical protein